MVRSDKHHFIHLIVQAYRYDNERENDPSVIQKRTVFRAFVSGFLAIASFLLSVMNLINGYWRMLITTMFLTVGFVSCAFMFGKLKWRKLPSALAATMVAFMFTSYAVHGNNEGFAILWILIVPSIAMNYIGLTGGTILGTYFVLLLPVLFYSPLRARFSELAVYSETFMTRFPVLYLITFVSAIVLTAQKDAYYHRIREVADSDPLTGLFNRRYYEEQLERYTAENRLERLTLISVDVNRLKYTNDTMGHEAGDELLTGAAACLKDSFSDAHAVCRIGGDEFMVISFTDPAVLKEQIRSLRDASAKFAGKYIHSISLAVGWAEHDLFPSLPLNELEKTADEMMYTDKRNFYMNSGLERRRN